MQHAEIKKPTTKTCTDRPSAECTNHGIQILRKRYTYPPNHSELGNIKYQEQCYGITESVKPYLAHYHFLCKETTHVDCNSQATSPILRWGTIPSTLSFVMQRLLHMWTAIFKQHHSISIETCSEGAAFRMWRTATVQVSRDVSDEPPSYSDHFAKSPLIQSIVLATVYVAGPGVTAKRHCAAEASALFDQRFKERSSEPRTVNNSMLQTE